MNAIKYNEPSASKLLENLEFLKKYNSVEHNNHKKLSDYNNFKSFEIILNNINFNYKDKNIFNNLNFKILPNSLYQFMSSQVLAKVHY